MPSSCRFRRANRLVFGPIDALLIVEHFHRQGSVSASVRFSGARSGMEGKRFDTFVKRIAEEMSRRRFLTGLFGLSADMAVTAATRESTDAARRGFAGPPVSLPTPPLMCAGSGSLCDRPQDCCSGRSAWAGEDLFFCASPNACGV
jgi:hypothetical protein